MNQKTTLDKIQDIKPKWYIVDATDKILGRLSTEVATVLRGKNSVKYTPHLDQGNYVCVINAEKIKVTGNKEADKVYYTHSGYMGNLKEQTLEEKRSKKPEEIISLAVKRMMPKSKLAKTQFERLKVYKGENHPHTGQSPIKLEIK